MNGVGLRLAARSTTGGGRRSEQLGEQWVSAIPVVITNDGEPHSTNRTLFAIWLVLHSVKIKQSCILWLGGLVRYAALFGFRHDVVPAGSRWQCYRLAY